MNNHNELKTIKMNTDNKKSETKPCTIPSVVKLFTCDVCFNETDNKKDEENYRYCNACEKL